MNDSNRTGNHLINETSPYLQAHAHNPVDWYPWGEEALQKAIDENKMIFLSIGYHTCHWCHVMEKECFEDETVAALLNRNFVSIKVDREERPDIDSVYMKACQVLTGTGGWPLNLWLTPDMKPVYAGTYFPRNNHPQRPGLIAVLEQLTMLWNRDHERVLQQGEQLTEILNQKESSRSDKDDTRYITRQAYRNLEKAFDGVYGGFSKAPKFPSPCQIDYLLMYWRLTGEEEALQMVERTLKCMAAGGIHDHIGGGFSRYSVDEKWLVPHFEKMLYDNAMLLKSYTDLWMATGNDGYKYVADHTYRFLMDEMYDGGREAFYTAYDADSEGEEGTYYLWRKDEVMGILGNDAGEDFCQAYDITDAGNFEGKNIPNRIKVYQKEGRWTSGLEQALALLKEERSKRIKPNLDDKTLMTGNSLAAIALYRYGKATATKEAVATADKITARLMGKGYKPVVLDDVAYLTAALLERHQTTQEEQALIDARNLAETIHEKYWDSEEGGYFLTAVDHESLICRPKEIYDGALPSGNSVMAMNLVKMFVVLGDMDCRERFEAMKKTFSSEVSKAPMYYSAFMEAWLQEEQDASCMVVALGAGDDVPVPGTDTPVPGTSFMTLYLKQDSALYEAFPFLEGKKSLEGRTTYYECDGFSCKQPVFIV